LVRGTNANLSQLIALIALVAVGAFYFTIVLTVLACIFGAGCILVTIWWINGTTFYLTANGKRVFKIRRFKIERLKNVK
jgi:hypothetical protein